jgi:acetyltransferase-like isoleucine patch superfamily enzyme
MLQDYRSIRDSLERGDFTASFPWEKIGPLWILDQGGTILIGDVRIFDGVRIRVAPGGHVEIGDYTHINLRTEIHCKKKVVIGQNCSIAWDVVIMDTDYHGIGYDPPVNRPTILEESVWVGNGATITKGVTVGRGSIVAAGSVVVKDVPPFTIVGGNPAKPLKEIEPFEGKHGQPYEPKWWDPSFVPKPQPQEN